jgi:DNA mismatch repair protein MutS
LLQKVTEFIARIDVALSNSITSYNLNYTRPEIIETQNDDKFLQILDLRHPLIEAQESQGIYITNDILLGSHEYIDNPDEIDPNILNINSENGNLVNGVLLYGINSSGKSSLMKSVGIAIILAQSGFYVPSKKMRFSLFTALFTRIVAKDNLAKGLSSFAVEMLELKNIFNRITQKSIVLGDEISHGTETLSGVSIVSSAIIRLIEKDSFFIFATHLHQLAEMEEIIDIGTVVNMHLAVNYDKEQDKLIFDRKLLAGSGSSIYGLEFARSLHMDKQFLDTANSIRKRLANDYDSVEMLIKKKTSKYNKNLFLSKCVICGKPVEEVHHIEEQKTANENGFIGHFSKDHKYNLIPLCKKHHRLIHKGSIEVNGFRMTSSGLELHYSEDIENRPKNEKKTKTKPKSLFDDF